MCDTGYPPGYVIYYKIMIFYVDDLLLKYDGKNVCLKKIEIANELWK